MLEVNDLSFAYPNGCMTLSGVTLAVEGGESVAIMGENGAGKTTLIRHFNGLLVPTIGHVLVDGLDTRKARGSDLARKVGLVFQNPYQQLFAQTVAQEVALGIHSDASVVVQEMLEAFHLQGLENRHPLSLSEGERKRLALAAVLAARPSILVLDEPTLGQDGREKASLAAVISSVRAQGKTVIVVTHDVDFAHGCCQRIVLLSGGHVVADGSTGEVVSHGDLLRKVGLVPPQLVDLSQRLGLPGLRELSAPAFSGGDSAVRSPLSETLPAEVPLASRPDRHGPLGRMDPRGKIVTALLLFVSLVFARHALALVLCAGVFLAAVIFGRLIRPWLRIVVVLLPVVGLVGVMDLAYFGPAHGAMVALRFVLTVSLFALFFLTTSLDDLSAALTSWRLPYPLVFALVTGARFGPTVSMEAREIMEAYRARGVDRSAGLSGWFRRYRRILIPLIAATIRRSLRLGEAMEMRGFGTCKRPTVMRDLVWQARDSVLLGMAVCLLIASIFA